MSRVRIPSAAPVVCIALAVAAVGAASAQTPRTERTPASLTGLWTLNRDLSDDAAKVMETMMGGDHGGGSRGGHTPPAGVGGGHGGGGGGMTPEQMRAMRAQMTEVLDAPTKLTIVEGDGTVTLTDNLGRSRRLNVNDKKEKRPIANRMVDVRTKWNDGRLVTETWLPDGMKLTETYSVSPERRLQVAVKVEGSHLPRAMNFRRIYDTESPR